MATCNVQTLLDSAACFDCLSPGLKRALELQLLCEILSAGGGGGSGTVTSVSVVTANGVSGSVATATSTPAITLTLNAITPTSVSITGTGGAGFAAFVPQASAPSAPASGYVKYADASGRMAWRRASDGFIRTFDSTLTANRVYTFPDSDSKFPIISQVLTFSGPTAARTITLPDANFTAARTDAGQTFSGIQVFASNPEIRNGTSATDIEIFKTYSGGGANYESLRIDGGVTVATEFSIKTLAAGTGVQRALSIYGGGGLWLQSDSGNVTLNAASSLVFRAVSATRFNMTSSAFAPQTDNAMDLGGSGLQIKSLYLATSAILASGCTIGWNADTFLLRNAAQTLAQRNSTTAQRFQVFNTYTDASNGEWLDVDWSTAANKLRFGTNKNGTGSTRILEFITGGTAAAQIDSSGNLYPATNNGQSSGISSNRWNSVWAQTKVQIGASGADVILTGEASGILQLGQDAGTPVAQRIKAFDGSGSNIAGSDLEVGGGQGTGTGVGGSFIVKGAPAGSSGSSLNAYQNNFIVTGAGDIQTQKTVTAAGTTGAQTINKPTGSVNFAAAATSLVVTNSLVTTSSVIIATVATNDATMKSVNVVAGSGSFTINANAAATAETRVNFIIRN